MKTPRYMWQGWVQRQRQLKRMKVRPIVYDPPLGTKTKRRVLCAGKKA